jgi:hypothetical protein
MPLQRCTSHAETRLSGTATSALDCYLPHMPGCRLSIPVPILCAQNIHHCILLNQNYENSAGDPDRQPKLTSDGVVGKLDPASEKEMTTAI